MLKRIKYRFTRLDFVICMVLLLSITYILFFYAQNLLFHFFTATLIFMTILSEINFRRTRKKAMTKKQIELEYSRVIILLFSLVLCAIGCSLLNWAVWGEYKINIGVIGALSAFVLAVALLYISRKIGKIIGSSSELVGKSTKTTAFLSSSDSA